jgi:LysM repeat protein
MATMQERWLGVPIAVRGLDRAGAARLAMQVARWQQARRQLCMSLLLGQRPDLDDRALAAILPERPLRVEARRWALWLVSGGHGLLAWYRQTLLTMPDDALWQREREFFSALRLQDLGHGPDDPSRLWRWHRRRGPDLGLWLADGATAAAPATLQPWIDHGAQPLLGQWLVWEGQWLIHLFWPGSSPETRSLPRVAAALLVPSLVSPTATGYRVQKGDTLWGIAQSRTGAGSNWRQVFAANRQQIGNPGLIYPGQVLTIPASAPAGMSTVPVTAGTIAVRPGDTLWRIARQQSGHGSWWPQIWQANRDQLRRPDRLVVGTMLRLPLSWSSGVQAVIPDPAGLPVPQPALAAGVEPSEGDSAATRPLVVAPVAKPSVVPRRAIRQTPTAPRRPLPPSPRALGALVPPPVVSRTAVPPMTTVEPVPLVPTVPEASHRSMTEPMQPAATVITGSPTPGQRATPLNRPESAVPDPSPHGSETTAAPASSVRWSDPEPLKPLPEPASASDATIGPAAVTVAEQPSLAGDDPVPTAPASPLPSEEPVPLVPAADRDQQATLRPAQGGADPWEAWLRPEIPDPAHPQRLVGFHLPQLAPAALWPQISWTGVPEYTTETAAKQAPLAGWALNRQRLSAEWQSEGWLLRGRWTTAQYGLAGADVRADRQESWVDVDFGQRWQVLGPLRLGLLGRATWWQRRGGMGQDTTLRAADLQGFGLGPVGQVDLSLGGGHQLVAEAALQPLMGISFSGPVQAAGQVGQMEGMLGWKGHWGAFQPTVGYRARWVYDADGRFGTVAHGLSAGLAIGWPGAAE